MAFDEALAERIHEVFSGWEGVTSKKMFGGLAFMLNGNMACGVLGEDLMVRVGPEGYDEAVSRPHARPMDFTGKPMKGMVYVSPAGLRSNDDLTVWVQRGIDYAASLPPK